MDSTEKERLVLHYYYVEKMSIRETEKAVPCSHTFINKVLRSPAGIGPRDIASALNLRSTEAYKEKIRQTKIGESNHQAKLKEADVLEIRAVYESLLLTMNKTEAQHLLAEDHKVKRPTISDIVLRKTWKHI